MCLKEGALYVAPKQLGVVASVKMMNPWENEFLFVTQNQRECALLNMQKHVYWMKNNS